MSILQHILLRHRAPGHLRFAIPKQLLTGTAGAHLAETLSAQRGVYRVRVFPELGKLSIRFFDGLTDAGSMVKALAAAAIEAERHSATQDQGDGGRELTSATPLEGESGWFGSAVQEARETVSAAGIVFRNVFNPPEGGRNGLVTEFLTDVLVLYLIKTHWHLIIQHWLKRPLQFRYEWSAAIYMIYLLVRSKKPKT